jgi:hypothetical protein
MPKHKEPSTTINHARAKPERNKGNCQLAQRGFAAECGKDNSVLKLSKIAFR